MQLQRYCVQLGGGKFAHVFAATDAAAEQQANRIEAGFTALVPTGDWVEVHDDGHVDPAAMATLVDAVRVPPELA